MTPHPFAPGVIDRGQFTATKATRPTNWLTRLSAIALSFCVGYAIGLLATAL